MKFPKKLIPIVLLLLAAFFGIWGALGALTAPEDTPDFPQPTPPTVTVTPPQTEPKAGLEVHFLDVGQASATLLLCDGKAMLVDGGNVADGQLLVSYLQDAGVEALDLIVGTHAHEDHVGGLAAVLARYETKAVWSPVQNSDNVPFRNFKKYAEAQGLTLETPALDSTYALGNARITVFGPRSDYVENVNNTSIVLRVDYGECSFLLSGDAEYESETEILDAGCDTACTVLLAGHHGSSTSNSYRWLREAAPKTAVISCGENNDYGHPHVEVLSRLADAEIDLLRTDMQGHIVCVCDGESCVFYTQYSAAGRTNPIDKYTGVFIGNRNSLVFHRESCDGLPGEKNRVYFDSREEAEAEGFTPCGRCNY